ncbi:hypothetical protein CLCR_09883 [Cladophialophora carrionii]|uniref:BZIP domain-containing protein n=1 Tax=Cladophialophora carrionii TaxID=86049 RepID=A0A1C1CXV8_9EURO|nr:hypothetical protein CLCR_09883 [Cladophialophora carrionii]
MSICRDAPLQSLRNMDLMQAIDGSPWQYVWAQDISVDYPIFYYPFRRWRPPTKDTGNDGLRLNRKMLIMYQRPKQAEPPGPRRRTQGLLTAHEGASAGEMRGLAGLPGLRRERNGAKPPDLEPFASGFAKVANRREQLRKAQKTFRDRRDQYLQTLEKTVQRQQGNEARLQNEVEHLKRELVATKLRLADREAKLSQFRESSDPSNHSRNGWRNFAYPSRENGANAYLTPSSESAASDAESFASSNTTLVWIETKNDQPVQLHVQLQGGDGTNAATSNTSSLSPNPLMQAGLLPAYVSQLDVVVVAMEFVLKLESPCLPHLRANAEDSIPASTARGSVRSSPHGHVHTASAALLCCSPSSSPLTASQSPSTPSLATSTTAPSWPIHKATLERLLDISETLPLDQALELTPVQAWRCIAQTPNFNMLEVDFLHHMSDKLLAHVRCYGFGAVVRRDFLMKLLAEVLW